MNVLDIILIIILVVAAVSGMRKGIITQACGIAGILLGIFLAFKFSSALAGWLNVGEDFSWLLSFIIIILAVALVLYWVGRLVRKLVHGIGLGIVDRIGGLLLGVVKWGLILSLLLGVWVNFSQKAREQDPKLITESAMWPPLKKLGDFVFPYILDAKEKYVDPLEFPDNEREERREERRSRRGDTQNT